MRQLIAIVISLCLLPILLKKNVPSGWALLSLGCLAGILGGLPISQIFSAGVNVFFNYSSLLSVVTVIEISMLGGLMTHYGLFAKAAEALKKALPLPRLIIMLMPSLIGILQVPGGAALSAPFCNSLGSEMGLSPSQRSNTNVLCRHVFSLFLPFSAWIILVYDLVPGLDRGTFFLLGLSFALLNAAVTWLVFLRNAQTVSLLRLHAGQRFQALGELAKSMSPILTILVLNLCLGIKVALCVPFSIAVTWLLSSRENFGAQVKASFPKNLAIMICSVYFFQNIVKRMDHLMTLGSAVIQGSNCTMFALFAAIAAILFGLSTGLIYVSLGVLLPIITAAIPTSVTQLTVTVFFAFSWSYIGYMFSPLHMCQILSDKICGSTIAHRYNSYIPVILLVGAYPVLIYLIGALFLF